MKAALLPADAPEGRMHCNEVWGGHGATTNHFTRPGLDIWIWSRVRGNTEAGGGDLHLLSSCASGRITRILLADVCGYDSLFLEIASELRELMVQNVNSIRQAHFVNEMCRHLESASHRGGYASTLLSTYFAPKRSLTLCNAGHPPPLLFRIQTREWSVQSQAPDVTPRKAPPGVVDRSEYQQFKTTLEVGDMALSFSNVLTECRSASGQMIGLNGLLNRVRQLDWQRPSDLAARLVAHVQSEHEDNLAMDDVTTLLCRATEKRVAWQDNLLAPFRFLRAVSDKTTIEPAKKSRFSHRKRQK